MHLFSDISNTSLFKKLGICCLLWTARVNVRHILPIYTSDIKHAFFVTLNSNNAIRPYLLSRSGGSMICRGIMVSARNVGPGAGPLVGVTLKLKALCPFSYKKWPKVKDFNENLPPCLRQTSSNRTNTRDQMIDGFNPS